MIYRMINGLITMIVCVSVICCTGPAWAGTFESCTYSRSAAGSSYSSSGTNMGTTSSYSGMGSVRSGGSFNPVSAFNSGMAGARAAVHASPSVTPGAAVNTGQKTGGPVGGLNTFVSTHNISSTGITNKVTTGIDNIKTATDVTATSTANTVESTGIGVQQSAVSNVSGVVQKFATMSADQKMQVMEYGNGSIWHYQETAGQVDANGQNIWQPSLNVLGDIWQGMSQEGQYTDKDGNIITNSPFGTNGAGQPENNMITPGEGFTWNDVKAAAYEWCAKNNVNTSCGLQEAQFNKMQYDLEAAGIIDMVNPQEMQSYLTNTGNTRANAEAFVNGQEVTPSASSGSWVAVSTDSFLGKMGTAGNSPFDTSESVNNDGVFVPSTIYINANASDAYVQQTFNEAWDLYGKGSCYTGRQLKMAVLNYMKSKGAIEWNEYFN